MKNKLLFLPLAAGIGSCQPACRSFTKDEFYDEWSAMWQERCPNETAWTPELDRQYCETTGFHPCRAQDCLDAWRASEEFCSNTTFRDYEACHGVFDSEDCGIILD